MSKRLRSLWPVIVLVAAVLLFFNKMALTNLILARGDTLLYFYPYWEAAAEALQAGRVPLWNPDLFMGAPFIANSQVGFFYPLNWPLWLLRPTPYAVSASIVIHLVIAAVGTYLAGRRQLGLGRSAAVLAAVLFGLGGYLTAQVEHVNQLQGLAWLPWFFAVWPRPGPVEAEEGWRHYFRSAVPIALLFTLQLLAGHSQTVFITAVGFSAWLLCKPNCQFGSQTNSLRYENIRVFGLKFMPLGLGVVFAVLLSAVQLLPTLELARLSSRQGGLPLNEVMSFSLHPFLAARALLPGYGQSLFSEYVAFLPLTALLLAFIAIWQRKRSAEIRPFLVLVILGIFLALGQFNPLYYLLGRLPGFNLFRVPARWLALYGFGMAMLAGYGWQVIRKAWGEDWGQRVGRPLRMGAIGLLALMLWGAASVPLADIIPVGPEAPVEWPAVLTVVGRLVELSAAFILISFTSRKGAKVVGAISAVSLLAVAILFLASRDLPYNNLTTPEAYFDLRPSITRLQAAAPLDGPRPRFLSLSNIFFDPGDLAEIETIYGDFLPEEAFYDYTIAIKQKEIIAPNLPLAYGLSSIDGFDGGVLPLESYTEVTTLLLPEGVETTDGRLREHLDSVPEAKWLDLFGARFIITDKVGDTWREVAPGQTAYFDLQHPQRLEAGERTAVAHIPNFDPTALFIIGSGVGEVDITSNQGQIYLITPELVGDDLWRAGLPVRTAAEIQSIELTALFEGWQINGLTLVNEADGTFHSLVLGNYRLIHSGDVKIYENLDVLPRAFMVYEWLYRPSVAGGVGAMRADNFDPARQAVIVADGPERLLGEGEGQVEILSYEPERIELSVASSESGLLVVTEANYPGWQAEIDGERVEIEQTNGLFRGVVIPAGAHEVDFVFRPLTFQLGFLMSVLTLLGWVLLWIWLEGRGRNWHR